MNLYLRKEVELFIILVYGVVPRSSDAVGTILKSVKDVGISILSLPSCQPIRPV